MKSFRFFPLVLLVLAIFSSASGQIYLDGVLQPGDVTIGGTVGLVDAVETAVMHGNEDLNNYGSILSAEVYGGWLTNYESGTIGTATVNYGGHFTNFYGTVGTAAVNDGLFTNYHLGVINWVTVNNTDGREFINEGTVNNVTLNSGGFFHYHGIADRATVNGGIFSNIDGTVHSVTVNDGEFDNVSSGSIIHTVVGFAMVNGGVFHNGLGYGNEDCLVEIAAVNGGTFYNEGGSTLSHSNMWV